MPCSRLVTAIAFALALSNSALAQMKVRVGQPQAGTFQFVPLQVANEAGIFQQHGIEVRNRQFRRWAARPTGARSGIDRYRDRLRTRACLRGKGSTRDRGRRNSRCPVFRSTVGSEGLAIRSPEDLKGKTISISSKASLTDWLGRELSRQLGWGPWGSISRRSAPRRRRWLRSRRARSTA